MQRVLRKTARTSLYPWARRFSSEHTFLHTKFALAAMKKGIHVLCEKPVSMEVGDVDLLYRTAEENHVKFMVAQCIRFWPEYVLLKEIYDTGRYGKLLSGEMERLGCYPKWSWDGWMMDEPRSGFVPFDLHIHDLDFVVYAFGAPSNNNEHNVETNLMLCGELFHLDFGRYEAKTFLFDGSNLQEQTEWC